MLTETYCNKVNIQITQRDDFIQTTKFFLLHITTCVISGPGSSVGIATDYVLNESGSNPGRDEIFHPSRLDLGPTQPPVK